MDILALNFGIAPCLKFLCIFDKNLQNAAKVEQLTVNWQKTGSEGKSDLIVEFKNSKAVMEIFSKIPGAACSYVVEITPPVEEVSTMWSNNGIQMWQLCAAMMSWVQRWVELVIY